MQQRANTNCGNPEAEASASFIAVCLQFETQSSSELSLSQGSPYPWLGGPGCVVHPGSENFLAFVEALKLRRSKPKTCALCQRSSDSGTAWRPRYTGAPGDMTTEPEGLMCSDCVIFAAWRNW